MPNDSPRSGKTEANRILERLLALSDGDLRNAIGVALEYKDHPSILGNAAMPAGNRLLTQLRLALHECESALGSKTHDLENTPAVRQRWQGRASTLVAGRVIELTHVGQRRIFYKVLVPTPGMNLRPQLTGTIAPETLSVLYAQLKEEASDRPGQ
jgi:hypothetical protein